MHVRAAVRSGGAPRREARPVRRHLLRVRPLDPDRLPPGYDRRRRRHVELLRLVDVDNDGYDAASQEADLLHTGRQTTPLFSTGNGAPGFGTTAPPSPSAGMSVGASTQFGGTGWDSIDGLQPGRGQRRDGVVEPRARARTARGGVDIVADGAYSRRRHDAERGPATAASPGLTWGGTSRSTPVAAGADGARLPGVAQGQRRRVAERGSTVRQDI